jgi:hypothetical protein
VKTTLLQKNIQEKKILLAELEEGLEQDQAKFTRLLEQEGSPIISELENEYEHHIEASSLSHVHEEDFEHFPT